MKKSELKKLIREEFQKITEKKVKSRINVEKLIEDFKTFQTDYKKAVDNSRDKKAELDDKYATILEKIFKNYNGEILDVAVDAMIYDKVVTIEQLEELQQYLEKTHRWKANRVNAALRRMLDYGRRIIMKDIEIRKYKDV